MNINLKELENQRWSLHNKKAECNLVIKEKGSSNIQVKIINEEIDEVNQKINQIQSKLSDEEKRFENLLNERENMQKKWLKDGQLHPMHLEVLQLMMKESIQIVENIETSTQH